MNPRSKGAKTMNDYEDDLALHDENDGWDFCFKVSIFVTIIVVAVLGAIAIQ